MLVLPYVYGAIKSELEHYGRIKADAFSCLKRSWARCYCILGPQGPLARVNYCTSCYRKRRERNRGSECKLGFIPRPVVWSHKKACHTTCLMYSFSGKWQPAPVARWICWTGKQQLKKNIKEQMAAQFTIEVVCISILLRECQCWVNVFWYAIASDLADILKSLCHWTCCSFK